MPETMPSTPPALEGNAEDASRSTRRVDPFRWVIEHPAHVDAAIFFTAGGLLLAFTVLSGGWGWWLPFSLAMVLCGAIARTRPALCITVVAALAVAHMLCGIPVVIGDVMTFYAMFCAIAYGGVRVSRAAVGLGLLGTLTQAVHWGVFEVLIEAKAIAAGLLVFVFLTIAGSITVIAIWALARLQNAQVRQLQLSRERAEQAVREREQRTALAVADERARIAREMHDVVAHSLSVIIAQADGGRFIASQQPEKAVEVLETIGGTGRAALADMRSLLGVLRSDEETSFGPQPGLDRLADLLERIRAAGLPIELDSDVSTDRIPQATSLSLFRLIQEALTNVLKHAGPGAAAKVSLHDHDGVLDVEVRDDGQGVDPDSDGQGRGLTGMRERVSVLGGTLTAGPVSSGGFRVRAVVPLGPTNRSVRLTRTPDPEASRTSRPGGTPTAPATPPTAPTSTEPDVPVLDPYQPRPDHQENPYVRDPRR